MTRVGWAATVNRYVDSTVGSNGDGTIGSPWKLLSNINWTSGTNNIKADVDAGSDVILNLKRDSSWTGTFIPAYSGASAGHPIIIQPYGTGAIPIISATSSYALNLISRANVTINGIYFYGGSASGTTVYLHNITTGIILNSCILDGDTSYTSAWGNYVLYVDGGTANATLNNCDIIRGNQLVYSAESGCVVNLYNCRLYGSTTPLKLVAGATINYDYCHIAGYRTTTTALVGTSGGHNIVGGVIGVKNLWRYGNNKYNISIDDCIAQTTFLDGMVTLLATYTQKPTFGVISGSVAAADWAGLISYYNGGCEMLSHSWAHHYPTSGVGLFNIRYVGAGAVCTMTISGNRLITTVDGVEDLNLDLSMPANPWSDANPYDMVDMIGGAAKLVATIDALPNYTCSTHADSASYRGNLTASAANITAQDIKTASYAVLSTQDILFGNEASFSRTALGIKFSGWNGRTYVVPGGSYSTTGVDIVQTYYDGGRNAQETANSTLKFNGVDVSKIDVFSPKLGTTEAEIIAYAQGMIQSAGISGKVSEFYGHQTGGGEYSVVQWGYFLEGTAAIPGLTYSSLDGITAYVRSQTLAAAHTYTGTTDTLDMRLTSTSSCKGAGSATYAPTTDVYGNAFAVPPSIGAMENQGTGVTENITSADFTLAPFTFSATGTMVKNMSAADMALSPITFSARFKEGNTNFGGGGGLGLGLQPTGNNFPAWRP